MKKLLLFLIVVGGAYAIYHFGFKKNKNKAGKNEPKEAPITAGVHSAAFNQKIDSVTNNYLQMKDAFIKNDAAAVKNSTSTFIESLRDIDLSEMGTDTSILVMNTKQILTDIESNANSILQQGELMEMRKDFNMVTEIMYPAFFHTINYEGNKLYFLVCANGFGEDMSAGWLSKSKEDINPYYGNNNPQPQQELVNCGVVKDSVGTK